MSFWKSFDFDKYEDVKIPPEPGCYAVYLDGRLSYIGQTTNLKKRFAQYGINWPRYSSAYVQTPWGKVKRVLVKIRFSRRFGDWAMCELRLIRRLQPEFNCVGSVKLRAPRRRAKARVRKGLPILVGPDPNDRGITFVSGYDLNR